jgi:hypothetical protein
LAESPNLKGSHGKHCGHLPADADW